MELTPIYQKPILYSNLPVTKVAFWDDAVTAFDEGEYYESLAATLNYINDDILKGQALSSNVDKIVYPHGSAEISFDITNGLCSFKSTFLKVPEKYKVPLLRKVAELNFNPLTLAQVVYDSHDVLSIRYEMPIELAQPNKTYDLIKEICLFADEYDDLFIKKYGAQFSHQPFVTPLTQEDQQTVWSQFEKYIDDALEYIQYFEEQRWYSYIWDIITNTLLSIGDHAYINGVLQSSIQETLWKLQHDTNSDLQRKITIGKSFLHKLQKTAQEDIIADIFLSKKFISTKLRTSSKSTKEFLLAIKDKTNKDIEGGDYTNAFFAMKYAFLNLMYTYNLDSDYWDAITESLANSSQTSWKDGCTTLKRTYDDLLSGEIDNKMNNKPNLTQKKGFFAKLFT